MMHGLANFKNPSYVVIMRELTGIHILFFHRRTVTKRLPMSAAEPCACRVLPRCFRIWKDVAADSMLEAVTFLCCRPFFLLSNIYLITSVYLRF
jgi:hypothetical protein